MFKRIMDISLAAMGLVFFAPLIGGVALAVWMDSGRPVFFRQVRVGRGGIDFYLWKFRTMRPSPGAEAGAFDAGDASRVTKIGRFLRSWKLDELPQLWNVLRGPMSLVGPRPEVRKWVAAYPARWASIHRVKPGLTDPASLVFRNEEALLRRAPDPEAAYRTEILPKKLDLYEAYVSNRTLWRDIRILVHTLGLLLFDHLRPSG
ncbi:MAG: sugar transferase [Planctomycetota bacterium]